MSKTTEPAHHHDGASTVAHTPTAQPRPQSDRMAASATLHCLTGCAIGEILGLIIGTALALSTVWTVVLAVSLAFAFGYALSILPLLRSGLALGAALSIVLAADTLSIAIMELVDNVVMILIPGAMEAGLVNAVFWVGMLVALTAAFFAAYPVNLALLTRGKGHALVQSHHNAATPIGARRFIPDLSSGMLIGVIVSFLLGGLLVSTAATTEAAETGRIDKTGTHASGERR